MHLQQVRQFTQAIKAPTCDGYSIGFWVRAVGDNSLTPDGQFFPTLSLLRSISPPEPYLSMGKMSGKCAYLTCHDLVAYMVLATRGG